MGLAQLRQVYSALAVLYNRQGQFHKTIVTCGKIENVLTRLEPTHPNSKRLLRMTQEVMHLNQGRAYLGLSDYINAARALQKATRLSPTNATHRYRLGLAYIGSGNYRQAVEALQQALTLKPAFSSAHIKLAEAYLALDEPKRAIAECKKILANLALNAEQQAEVYYLSGVAYLELGSNAVAVRQLARALSLYSDVVGTIFANEPYNRRRGRLKAMREAYEKATAR